MFVVSGNSRVVATPSRLYSSVELHDLLSGTRELLYYNVTQAALNHDASLVALVEETASSQTLVLSNRLTSGRSVIASASGKNVFNTPVLSPEGRFLVYRQRRNLGNATESYRVYAHDALRGTTTLLTPIPAADTNANPAVWGVQMSADGRTVVFHSASSQIAPGDYNDKLDVFVVQLGMDNDRDGLDDDWEVAHFGDLSRDGAGDFDGDGASNYHEFVAGTAPTSDQSIFRVTTLTVIGSGARRLVWTGNPARSYRIQFKDALTELDWRTVDAAITWDGDVATAVDGSAVGHSQRYYRVVSFP